MVYTMAGIIFYLMFKVTHVFDIIYYLLNNFIVSLWD